MVPDLPYVRKDVPDATEAPVLTGRFAWQRRSARLLLVPASNGLSRLRALLAFAERTSAGVRTARAARMVVAVSVASAVGLGVLAPVASADDLTDHRDQVKQQIAKTQTDLNESTRSLSAAAVAVDRAQGQLELARAALANTRGELATARLADIRMAAKLKKAQAALVRAKAAVVAGQQKLAAQSAMAGNMVRDQYQQQTNLLPIAILVASNSTADLQTRLQWSTTMFDTTQAEIDRLTLLQRELKAERAKQATIEAQIAADRLVAAANLKVKKKLERRATTQEANVASLVHQRQVAESAAANDVAADRARYAALSRERASVEHRIAVRIAKAKAEAARQAAAARAAKIAARRAAAAERAQEQAVERARQRAAAAERARRQAAERARQRAAKRAGQTYHPSSPKRSYSKKSDQKKPSSSRISTSRSRTSGSSPSRTSTSRTTTSRTTTSRTTTSRTSTPRMNGASHGFSFPVTAGITSPYGMRFHPVLHRWKLHDGTDFGAGCGTAIRAPYSGRVAEKYFNAGYGNRLMIDHGFIDGRYVTTGYNHAIRYTVGVGDQVSKGEVIGYVGTTGYSTGCHLHLMVWLDGSVRNPMTWF